MYGQGHNPPPPTGGAPFTQGGLQLYPHRVYLAPEGSPSPSHITNGKGGVGGGVPDAPGNLTIIATFRANRRGGFHIRPQCTRV